MKPTRLLLTLALLVPIPTPSASAQDRAAPAEGPPRFLLEARDGSVREADAGRFRLDGSGAFPAAMIRVEGAGAAAAARIPDVEAVWLQLTNGDRVRGRIAGGQGEVLSLELIGGAELSVPIEMLRTLRFTARLESTQAGPLPAAEEGDRLFRVAGSSLDRIDGTVDGFTPEGVRFESVLGTKLFPWAEVAALQVEEIAEESQVTPPASGHPVIVDLADGSRLRGALSALDGTGAMLAPAASRPLRLPLEAISEIVVDDGSIAFLSDLAPRAGAEGAPFGDDLGMVWPFKLDRSVTGKPLRAGGRTYSRGIGVHAPSRLTFRLDGSWSALRGAVAVDDQVLRLAVTGSVVFRVELDGKRVFESRVLRAGDLPQPLPELELAGVRELVLEVDMSEDYHLGDRADWLRMLLVR